MIVLPAIDIKDGKVIRLHKGRFDEVTEYADDPLAMAKRWKSVGARWLHLVDLDGAKTGVMANKEIIIRIAQEIGIPVEVGGGIRSLEIIDELLTGGLRKVILGTRAIEDRNFLATVVRKWADRLIVSLDCSNGMLAQRGWTETSNIRAVDFAKDLQKAGIGMFVYTDIARDGTLSGPNIPGLLEMLNTVNVPVIASGGISSLDDIKKLLALKHKNLFGVITGKALYEDKLDLKEAIGLCSENG